MARVLYVGHDRELAVVTERILSRHGYHTQVVYGPGEAERTVNSRLFDLVIMDYETTEAERNRFCRELKQGEESPLLLVITGEEGDEIPVLHAGADDWIKKPYRIDVLLARMTALLRQNQRKGGPRMYES